MGNMNYFDLSVSFSVVTCCKCSLEFALSKVTHKRIRDNHTRFYCPSCGTPQSYTSDNKEEELRKKVEYLRGRNANLLEQKEHYQNTARTYKGHVTRIKNRVSNGVCPCCNRTFKDLQRHMKSKHPDYTSIHEPPTGKGESDG